MDVGGGDNAAVPLWAIFILCIFHCFMCWSGEDFEKCIGCKFEYLLEEEGRKPLEFLYWTTSGVLGFLLLWSISEISLWCGKRGVKTAYL